MVEFHHTAVLMVGRGLIALFPDLNPLDPLLDQQDQHQTMNISRRALTEDMVQIVPDLHNPHRHQ